MTPIQHIRRFFKKLRTFYVLELTTSHGKFASRQPLWWRHGMQEKLPKLVADKGGNLILVRGWAIRPAKGIWDYIAPRPVF